MSTATSFRASAGVPAPSGSGHSAGRSWLRHVPVLVLLAVAAGAAAVLGLWWYDTPRVSGLGDLLTNAGRITGLLGGYSVVVQLLLMARVPVVERGVGADRLARWHSFGGRYTVSLLSAHVVLIIWGYAVAAHTDVVAQTSTLLLSYPDILLATAGFLLLLGVAGVSMRAARQRLRYETWFYLHFYTYLAVALSFAHQFASGADFVDNRPARVGWSAFYAGTAALLLWYRLLTPVRASLRHRVTVAEVRREGPEVVSVLLRGRHLDELAAEPGQFFRWRFLTRDGWWQSHPFSLSAPPHPGLLRVTVKSAGDHTGELAGARTGTRVAIEGPYGAFTADRRRRRKVLLLAAGVGIAPLRALLETLPAAPGDLTLVYRVRRAADILFRREIDALAAARGARVHYLVGPRGGPADPFVGSRLAALVPGLAEHSAYVCGPPGFIAAGRATLSAAGVPARHVIVEDFSF